MLRCLEGASATAPAIPTAVTTTSTTATTASDTAENNIANSNSSITVPFNNNKNNLTLLSTVTAMPLLPWQVVQPAGHARAVCRGGQPSGWVLESPSGNYAHIYIYIYMCIYLYLCMSLYPDTSREREREIYTDIAIYP